MTTDRTQFEAAAARSLISHGVDEQTAQAAAALLATDSFTDPLTPEQAALVEWLGEQIIANEEGTRTIASALSSTLKP